MKLDPETEDLLELLNAHFVINHFQAYRFMPMEQDKFQVVSQEDDNIVIRAGGFSGGTLALECTIDYTTGIVRDYLGIAGISYDETNLNDIAKRVATIPDNYKVKY